MSFFHKKMSQNLWATIMPFEPVTLIFYWPNKKNSGTGLGCIDNNNIELINNYLYHYVTVISTCFMFHQRLLRCTQQSTKQGKHTSSYSLCLATSANVIYDIGISTSGEPGYLYMRTNYSITDQKHQKINASRILTSEVIPYIHI